MTKKINPNLTKSEALAISWRKRKDFKGYDTTKGSLFNTWRNIVYNKKSKEKGFPESWKDFDVFCNEVGKEWHRGWYLVRKDITKPYTVDNVEWRPRGEECLGHLTKFEFNGETKTILEWCQEYNLNYNGVRQRYFRRGHNNYTPEQILFGKRKQFKKKITDYRELSSEQKIRDKVSKMRSTYRLRDKQRGRENDIDFDYLYNIVTNSKCVYCGDNVNVGLDRLDNSKGHTKDNVVPCCYTCNCVRSNLFSYEEMRELGKTIRKIKNKRDENK